MVLTLVMENLNKSGIVAGSKIYFGTGALINLIMQGYTALQLNIKPSTMAISSKELTDRYGLYKFST